MSVTLNLKPFFISFISIVIVSVGLFYFIFPDFLNQKKYPVTIAVSKTPLSNPFYVAKAINAFDGTCVSVEYLEVIGGMTAFGKVMNGDVDFGTSSDSVIAFQSLSTQTFVTHTMFSQSDNDVKLITRTADDIQSVMALKGKKIGVIKRSASEYLLSTLLAIEGLVMADVKLYYYKPEDLLQALHDHQVDAIVPWEPYAYQISQLLGDKIKTHDTKNLSTLSFNLISLPPDPLLVEKASCVILGLQKAIDYISANPIESKKIVLRALNLEPSFIEWVWPDYIFKLGLNQSLKINIESQARWAIETQISEYREESTAEHFIDSRALLQVAPDAVNLSR